MAVSKIYIDEMVAQHRLFSPLGNDMGLDNSLHMYLSPASAMHGYLDVSPPCIVAAWASFMKD